MPNRIRFDRCELRPDERQLLIEGRPAALGARAFDLLVALVERHDRVVGKGELFDTVWPGLVVEENNLQVQVSSLRKLLGPQAIATVPGRGYQFVGTLAEDAADPSASDVTPIPPNNIPHARTRFIGREAALSDCANLLERTRLLTLSGIGGCGKTRLAQELAQRQLSGFPDGVWFVDLGPLQEAQRVSATVANTIGVQAGQLTDHLKARRALIVVDSCEHVIGAAVQSIEALLENCGGLKIIATSREVLGTAGEQVYAVRSLSLPSTSDLEAVRGSEAVRLFVDHARLVVPEFDVDAHNAATIADICRRLDGIALAIELAAARVRILDLEDIRARLDDRFRLLTGGSRALPRHQTLQATMQWSHDLLNASERRLFRRLAVFARGCTLPAAAAVDGEDDEYEVLECLTALHDKSLVIVDRDTQAQPRYRMLETVRQYAEDRLNEAGESDEIRTRHLMHYIALAERAGPELRGPRQGSSFATLHADEENLLAAHAWCARLAEGGRLALHFVGCLSHYWCGSRQPQQGYRLAADALALAEKEPDSIDHCRCLHAMALCAIPLGRYDAVQAAGERCLAIAGRLGATDLVIDGLRMASAGAILARGPDPQSMKQTNDAIALARSIGDNRRLAILQNGMGEIHRARGDLAAAELSYREAIRLSRSDGAPNATAMYLDNLAGVLIARGRLTEAHATLAESMSLVPRSQVGVCLLDLTAVLASSMGDHAAAARFHGAAHRLHDESGTRREPVDEAFIAPRIARSRIAMGEDAFDAAQREGRALGHDAYVAELDRWLNGRKMGDGAESGCAT